MSFVDPSATDHSTRRPSDPPVIRVGFDSSWPITILVIGLLWPLITRTGFEGDLKEKKTVKQSTKHITIQRKFSVPRIQIINVSTQGNRQHVVSRPKTSQLLIVNGGANCKGSSGFLDFNVPYLASLVTRARQKTSASSSPSYGINSSSMSVFTASFLDFTDDLGFFAFI